MRRFKLLSEAQRCQDIECNMHPIARKTRRNDPEHEAIIIGLLDALEGCRALETMHGEDCQCSICRIARGSQYILEQIAGTLMTETFYSQRLSRRAKLYRNE